MRKAVITAGLVGALLNTGLALAGPEKAGSAAPPAQTRSMASTAIHDRPATVFDMPNGVKVVVPADPPVGQEYAGAGALIVPAGTTWKLVGFTFNVTFDTTKVGSGNVSLVIRDANGDSHLRIPLANGLDRASRYVDFSGWIGASLGPTQNIDHECILASLPDLILPAGWQITTLTEGRKTTDRVKEMQLWVQEVAA